MYNTNFYFRLQGFLKTYIDKLNEATEYLKTEEGEEIALDALKINNAWEAGEIVFNSGKIAWNAYKVGKVIGNVRQNIQNVKAVKTMKGTVLAFSNMIEMVFCSNNFVLFFALCLLLASYHKTITNVTGLV